MTKHFAVVGAGSIGRRHAGNFQSIDTAVTNHDLDPGARVVDMVEQCIERVDRVVICTPPAPVPLTAAGAEQPALPGVTV